MEALFGNPVAFMLIICAGASLILALVEHLLEHILRTAIFAWLVPSLLFLLAFSMAYQKIPDFPPIGATSKIFYIVIVATLFGLMIERATERLASMNTKAAVQACAAAIVSFAASTFIALPILAYGEAGFIGVFVCLSLGGAIILWGLQRIADAALPQGGGFVATCLLAVFAAACAPMALFGASAIGACLCFGLSISLATLAAMRGNTMRPFGAAAVLGVGGGLCAMMFTTAFISQHIDFVVLPLLFTVLSFGQIGVRLTRISIFSEHAARVPTGRAIPWRLGISIAILAVALIALISGCLFLRHDNPLIT